jgi:hypothetical protein
LLTIEVARNGKINRMDDPVINSASGYWLGTSPSNELETRLQWHRDISVV